LAVIGKPPEDVIDREEEVSRIVDSMTDQDSNANYALVGHRRIGKSTIMLEVKRRLERHDDIIVGYIDLGEFRHSPVEFAESLTEALTSAHSKKLAKSSRVLNSIGSALSQIAEIKRLRARFIASVDEYGSPRIEIDPYVKNRNENYAKALTNVFDYANGLSKASNKRIVIMIDEFQHVIDYRKIRELENILDIIKTILERRANVSFVVSGSRIHYLKEILGQGGSPLFGHFVILDIGPLEKRYALELFAKSSRISPTQKEREEAYKEVGGHPYYLVMLAEGRKKDESIKDAYARLLTTPTGALYLYVNYILTEDLGSNYKDTNYPRILASLAGGEKSVSEISKDTSIRLTDMPKLLTTLIEYDLVRKSDKKYSITDKVIRDFFYLVRKGSVGFV
jgi:AAA+ ATPase superfamily predicted ATPase